MNRRDALKLGTALASSMLLPEAMSAESKALRVLLFGGTGFIGPHFVETLRAHGHKLTLFNRGKRNPGLFPDVETLLGDRNGQVDALEGRDWDVVIDDSGYLPAQVRLTAGLLKDRVQHYIFVSSISAYADLKTPGIDEDYALETLKDPNVNEVTAETYGGLKAVCEQIVEQTFGERQAVIRPTYIVGPGDHTDRFTYWPARVARGGQMLAPGSADDPIQFIDVRDLAEFMRRCVEQRIAGRYNLCNPPGAVTIGSLLDVAKRVSKSNTTFVWADPKFLEAQKLLEGNEIPIWRSPQGDSSGAPLVSSARAVAKGLRFRDLETTVRDTLAWHDKRPEEQKQKMRAGLTAEREAELLRMLKHSA
jgi:2'-hydroxyisoflavone reductase